MTNSLNERVKRLKDRLKYKDIKVSIPRDIIEYSKKKIIKRVVAFILSEIIALFIAYLFSINSTEIATMFTYLIAIFLPFIIVGVPHKLIDKTWIGEVVKVNVATNATAAMKDGPKSLTMRTNVNLYVKEENGNLLIKRVSKTNSRIVNLFNEFKEGDIVMHVYGTDCIFKVPLNDGMSCKCTVCGTSIEGTNKTCGRCGHTLIKADYQRGY